ncbi:MAG: leucine-rich repeat domain-containing protein [Bacteroidales bacterium]|nr:leucine-rich repeat domain-containing protein [Bacteroidales bacterium]
MNDLNIIREIEKELRVNFRVLRILNCYHNGYISNKKKQVVSLSLYRCNTGDIKRIINFLKEFQHLQVLYLKGNQISDCSSLKELKHLQMLNLADNQISDCSFLKELKQLQSLDLGDNQISDCSILKELKELRSLDLSNNQISNISFLNELNQLQSLDLSINQISDYSSLKVLNQLQLLNLSGNGISDISSLNLLTELQLLWLADNCIKDISHLKGLKNLQRLQLLGNKISDISPLKQLENLSLLGLCQNKITELPTWIIDFNMKINYAIKSWEEGCITLNGNPLKNPPVEIVKQGKEAIRDYFKSLEGNKKVKLNEVKVLLVGEGMSGKTSLLRQFQGEKFNKDESQTHGINVVSLQTKDIQGLAINKELKDCHIHFWDFGGQEIMHASHQFFMSKRSLYILVLDSRTDSRKDHWLKHIEKFGGDSPVIVVMNKIDDNPNYNIEQKKINDNFPQIKSRFHRISCLTKEGFTRLVECLANTIPETSLFGTEISIDWMNIKEKLVAETKAKRYINRKRFVKICEDNNVSDPSSQKTLLQYLNDLGIVLYFEQLDLPGIYVLDPHWVTIGVYKIINSHKIRDGILHKDDLGFILNEEEIKKHEYDPAKKKKIVYSDEEWPYILSIMVNFELCYEYGKGKDCFIIPDLLPKELQNEPDLNIGKPLRFVMEYDYLPSSILPRLMIRLKNDIVDGQQWRYGMVLESKEFECKAKIKEDEPNKRIEITVQGESHYKQRYFSAIRHNILSINKEFENLEVKEFIPLPGYPNEFVKYTALLGHERAGLAKFFNGDLDEWFSVSDMLDSVINKQERSKDMGERSINISVKQGDQVVNVNQNANLTATQQQTVSQEIKIVQDLFKNLKDDILKEVDIEVDDEKERKRIKNELQKAEEALSELEKAASEGKKEVSEGLKDRLKEFFDNLSDEKSRLNKALKLVSKGAEKLQKFGKFYNNVAPFFALPSIPPVLLGEK